MKILILISAFLCFELFSFSEPIQIQTNSKVLMIHKTKRIFVLKKDRPYLKKKVIELPIPKHPDRNKK